MEKIIMDLSEKTSFLYAHLETWHAKYLRWKLLDTIIFEFRQEVRDVLSQIPKGNRNKGFVLAIIEQILSTMHGPTRTALDWSKALINSMGKSVLLVNTVELLPLRGEVPFFCL